MTNLSIIRGDITTLAVDVIVNAANSSLMGGGGVDGAIHRAGGKEILAECTQIRRETYPDGLPTGQAVATTAGKLPSRWVIHTVGPVYDGTDDRRELLVDAYRNSLQLARDIGASTIAFPLISAGVYGWPMGDAAHVAVETCLSEGTGLDITLVGFSDEAVAALTAIQ